MPRAFVCGDAVDGDLHFVAALVVASPDYAVAGFFAGIQDSDDIAGSEFYVEAGEQCAAQADVAGVNILQETLAFGVNAPDGEREISSGARFPPTILFLIAVFADSHAVFSPLAAACPRAGISKVPVSGLRVKKTSEKWGTKVRRSCGFGNGPEMESSISVVAPKLIRSLKVVIITTYNAMEKAISAADANRKFSQVLREVREGRSFVVTSHGRPVARITPVEQQRRSKAKAALLAHLKARPVGKPIGRWTRDELYD